jgi:hypothetical protein
LAVVGPPRKGNATGFRLQGVAVATGPGHRATRSKSEGAGNASGPDIAARISIQGSSAGFIGLPDGKQGPTHYQRRRFKED